MNILDQKEEPVQKRSSKFSFSRQHPLQEESKPVENDILQNLKNKFKGSMQSLIKSNSKEISTDPQQEGLKFTKKLGVILTEENQQYIKFTLDDYYNKYTEQQILGEGCIGLVKQITRKQDSKLFAVKIVRTTDEEIVRNMILEFFNLQKLYHQNIVQMEEIYVDWKDGYQAGGIIHVVMEKINGQEMFAVINSLGHYSEFDARKIFLQILEAIQYLHNNYVCHRDLKPNNILCSVDCKYVKITDFNVSKFSDSYKEFGNLEKDGKIEMWTYTGTVAFSAPELLSGGQYNEQIDMWSAGCILFTMLSGQLPFNSEYLNDLIEKIQKGIYEMCGPLWDSVSYEAKELIKCLLEVDPQVRITPEKALNHCWIVNQNIRKATLKRDDLVKNLPHLTPFYMSPPGKMKALCYLFGAGEIWKRHGSARISQELFNDDFRKTKSFDVTFNFQKQLEVKKVEGSKNEYDFECPEFDDDEEQKQ